MFAVNAQNVKKWFGNGKKRYTAIANLSLQIEPNQIFGLLGSNGAGKTTFLSLLATTLNPNEGSISIYGKDTVKQKMDVRRIISVCSGYSGLFDELTVMENMIYYAKMQQIPDCYERIDEMLRLVGLLKNRNSLAGDLSTGMRQRLSIAIALLNKPKLLLLDEPTAGLDPAIAVKVRRNIKKVQKKLKMTIILTTHNMNEVEQLCRNIALMKNGKIIALESMENLRERLGCNQIIEVETEKQLNKFRSRGVVSVKKSGQKVVIEIRDAKKNILPALEKLRKYGISRIAVREITMEELFLAYAK